MSLIKAMAMGAIPITSRFPNSTLPELTDEWDMGPREALSGHVQVCPEASVRRVGLPLVVDMPAFSLR